MGYLQLVMGLVSLLGTLVTYLRDKQLMDAGGAREVARLLREIADETDRATKAREAAHARNAATSGSLPDDGHRRD